LLELSFLCSIGEAISKGSDELVLDFKVEEGVFDGAEMTSEATEFCFSTSVF
jgi:hypothetical protein